MMFLNVFFFFVISKNNANCDVMGLRKVECNTVMAQFSGKRFKSLDSGLRHLIMK
jgi:hypothetical protein